MRNNPKNEKKTVMRNKKSVYEVKSRLHMVENRIGILKDRPKENNHLKQKEKKLKRTDWSISVKKLSSLSYA